MNQYMKLLAFVALLLPGAGQAATIYTNEAEYRTALNSAGYGIIHEGFEQESVWADTRNFINDPGSAAFVSNRGILWSSNLVDNNISTGTLGGSVVDGSYGFYSNPHGNQNAETSDSICDVPDPIPGVCFLHDGFMGGSESAGTLYGVGGWVQGTFGADVSIFLDGVEVDFGAAGSISGWSFLGVIDQTGFDSFEFRELDGKGGQAIYIFADDFSIGVDPAFVVVPLPAASWLFASGILALAGIVRRRV